MVSENAVQKKRAKTVIGEVSSDGMEKTISVRVTRLERHPMYQKYVRRKTSYKAHDENGEARVGDVVRIVETRPLSKTKRWRLVEIVRRSAGAGSVPVAPDMEEAAEEAKSTAPAETAETEASQPESSETDAPSSESEEEQS